MRITIMTDDFSLPSGQARVGRELALGLLKRGHEVSYIGWFHSQDINNFEIPGMKCFFTNNNNYGSDILDSVVTKVQPEVLLTIGDFWNLNYIADTNYCRTRRTFQWCFKGDTDIVTRSGIKNIQEALVGDEVLSVSPTDGSVSYKRVMSTQKIWFEGNMVNIKGKYVDFSVTPDHRFLMKQSWKKNNEWMTAESLKEKAKDTECKFDFPRFLNVKQKRISRFKAYQYLPDDFDIIISENNMVAFSSFNVSATPRHHAKPGTYTLKIGDIKSDESFFNACESSNEMPYIKGKTKDRSLIPAIMDMGDFLELAGWFISEGSIEIGECNRIHIAQQEENKFEISHRKELKALLKKMGLNYKEKSSGFTIAGLPIVKLMSLFGDKSGNKKLPDWIFELSHEELARLFKSMMMGDGSRTGELYCTSSSQLKQDFMRLCFHLGYAASIGSYGVSIRKFRNKNSISSKHISEESFFGHVYCVTVAENSTLLAGRNGKFQFTGNCSYIPVDGEPLNGGLPPAIIPIVEDIDMPIAYTDYAREAVLKSVFDQETRNRIKTIYHGVDTNIFKPVDFNERKRLREQMGIGDKFLFLTVSRNQSRKNIPELLRAWKVFSELPEMKGKVTLWPHMNFNDPMGWKIDDLLTVLKLRNNSIIYYDQVAHAGSEMSLLPEAELAKLYQIADAFVLLSGEGFGLPTFEAMATRMPCVLLDYAASAELGAEGRAEMVPVGNSFTWTGGHLTQRPIPDISVVVNSLTKVYKDRAYRNSIANKGFDFASRYTWDKVLDEWNDMFLSYEMPFIKPMHMEVIS